MKTANDQRKILANNLQSLLNSRGITQTDMARDLDLKETTVSSWMNAKKYPRIDSIQLMADYFNVPRSRITEEIPNNMKKVTEMVRIPVLGKVACGDPILAEENIEEYKERPADNLPGGTLFYLTASGTSMEPRIPDGSLVLCRKQEDVESGEIAAVLVSGNEEATLKRIRKVNDMVILEPINSIYEPYYITKDNPGRIIGKAIEVTSKL